MKLFVTLIITAFFFNIHSETHITGDISAMTLDMSGNPYIVEQDIMIPEGKSVVINEGCIFLFQLFTGLTVQGQLVVKGSQDQQVIFSSINDGDYNPASEQLANPFDWNGILVLKESGSSIFENFALRYSVYGLKSQNPNIQITNGLFRQNGQFHFTINDKIQFVQDNIPFSFNGAENKPEIKKDTPPPVRTTSDTRLVVRFVSLGIGVAGAVTGIVFGAQTPGALNEWDETTKPGSTTTDQFTTKKKQFNNKVIGAALGGVVGAIGLTVFGFTFKK